jgi:hypothetical protein
MVTQPSRDIATGFIFLQMPMAYRQLHNCGVKGSTSASCDNDMSTRVLAAGWMISNNFIIVAPSFEIVTPCREKALQLRCIGSSQLCNNQ